MDALDGVALVRIAARAEGGFFRLGRHWPREGVAVTADAFDEAGWDILLGERNLHIEPAPEAGEPDPAELRAAVIAAIGALEDGDFDKAGRPKLAALRKRVAGVTAALADEVWAELKPKTD
ncbi:hypothetical protein [Albidovulum sp.]|uniref:hypothetical protein n=1 Tax=Albidovulum sp. TaxID=1872424 RepID=UPI0039B85D85